MSTAQETKDAIIANLTAAKLSGKQPDLIGWLCQIVKDHPDTAYLEVCYFCREGGNGGEITDVYRYISDEDVGTLVALATPLEVLRLTEREVSRDVPMGDGSFGGALQINLTTMQMRVSSFYDVTETIRCDDRTVSLL